MSREPSNATWGILYHPGLAKDAWHSPKTYDKLICALMYGRLVGTCQNLKINLFQKSINMFFENWLTNLFVFPEWKTLA